CCPGPTGRNVGMRVRKSRTLRKCCQRLLTAACFRAGEKFEKFEYISPIIFSFYSTFGKLKSCKYKIVKRKEQISRPERV
ncbi:MAG: hypothetical protein D3922_14630, partial [Candidatus Electrothrix sp. AR1]|nr:hypothetical protein [Candidatus Electrothrix sp. AR1]